MSVWDPVGTECKGHQPGTDTLMRVSGEIYGTTANGQTYVCRQIDGSTRLSFHAEGRAGDSSGYPAPMRALADAFVKHALELGIQEVIYDRERWSTDDGTPGWEPYGGADPHTSHVHWSLTWDAAQNLTEAKIRHVLEGAPLPEEDELPFSEADLRKIISEEVDKAILKRLGPVADGAKQTIHETARQAIRVTKPKA